MHTDTAYVDHAPELRAAVDDAARLVLETRGTNLDPIIQALDERLLAQNDDLDAAVTIHLRRDLSSSVATGNADRLSGQQVAATILCSGDDRIRVPLLAAVDGGLPALVPTIAATVFGGLRPPTLAMASALAALVVVRGLAPWCRDMGCPVAFDRLAQVQVQTGTNGGEDGAGDEPAGRLSPVVRDVLQDEPS